jgi:AraC-like DNA-binding protein
MHYTLSRLSILDVKWADLFDGNNVTFPDIHLNPYYELILVADGIVHLQAGDEQLTLQSGDSLLLMPWEQHRGWKPREHQGQFYWVQFSCEPGISEFAADPAHDLKIVHAPPAELRTVQAFEQTDDFLLIPRLFHTRHRYKLLGCFEELVEVLTKPKGHFRFQATLLLGKILHIIADECLDQNQIDSTFPSSYTTFRKLVNYLNNFYQQDISKESLERTVDRKYEYLCQVFKRYSGTTIVLYTNQLRIQQAKHLLMNTGQSVREIGEAVGYQDPFYFSRMFKRLEGLSPQQFRQTDKHNKPSPT